MNVGWDEGMIYRRTRPAGSGLTGEYIPEYAGYPAGKQVKQAAAYGDAALPDRRADIAGAVAANDSPLLCGSHRRGWPRDDVADRTPSCG